MVKQLLLLGSSVALLASQNVFASCVGDFEMHGNQIKNITVDSFQGASEAANKHYIDQLVKTLDKDRLNGVLLSEKSANMPWTKSQEWCAKLESKAIVPNRDSVSRETYSDWRLPTRVEYLSACLAHGSEIDYDTRTYESAGQCALDMFPQWVNNYHPTSMVGQIGDNRSGYLRGFTIQAGKGEAFTPSTGVSIREHGDNSSVAVRCTR